MKIREYDENNQIKKENSLLLKNWIYKFVALSLLFPFWVSAEFPKDKSLQLDALYHSIDPTSLSKLFAFYELYETTPQGVKAKKRIVEILKQCNPNFSLTNKQIALPTFDLTPLIAIVNKQPFEKAPDLSESSLSLIEDLCAVLKHRSLKGNSVTEKKDLYQLDSSEIDLSRALLLYQFENHPESLNEIRRYEACIDLLALQIIAKLPKNYTSEDLIYTVNEFIFHEMAFKFPPHGLWVDEIDTYTLLPSVLDSRRGVCLGVSILYLCLAQRLGVEMEIATPPGHIFVSYTKENGEKINIETTARGIHIPDDKYLSLHTYAIKKHPLKDVIAMSFINQASILWKSKKYTEAIDLYEEAIKYMPNDEQLNMFLGINYFLIGNQKLAEKHLQPLKGKVFDTCIYKESLIEDILEEKVSKASLEAVFQNVDESRQSIIDKQECLKKALETDKFFKSGYFQLAITYLQLGRSQEALDSLLKVAALDPCDPVVNYYLSVLFYKRFQFQKSWNHALQAEKILSDFDYFPKALKDIKNTLLLKNPSFLHDRCNKF